MIMLQAQLFAGIACQFSLIALKITLLLAVPVVTLLAIALVAALLAVALIALLLAVAIVAALLVITAIVALLVRRREIMLPFRAIIALRFSPAWVRVPAPLIEPALSIPQPAFAVLSMMEDAVVVFAFA